MYPTLRRQISPINNLNSNLEELRTNFEQLDSQPQEPRNFPWLRAFEQERGPIRHAEMQQQPSGDVPNHANPEYR